MYNELFRQDKKTPYWEWKLFIHGCESPSLLVSCWESTASFQKPLLCTLPHFTRMTLTCRIFFCWAHFYLVKHKYLKNIIFGGFSILKK
jgi:hypothetical protein